MQINSLNFRCVAFATGVSSKLSGLIPESIDPMEVSITHHPQFVIIQWVGTNLLKIIKEITEYIIYSCLIYSFFVSQLTKRY